MTRPKAFDYESRHEAMLARDRFMARLLAHGGLASLVIAVSLLAGVLGYRWTEGMSWLDAYLNAAMILGGMGPVAELRTAAGKLFAGTYALYSGVVVLVSVGILIAPVAHRILHRFHAESGGGSA